MSGESGGKLFFLGKEFHSGDESLEQGAIYAFESADDGKTWQKLCKIDFPEGLGKSNMHEPHAVELPDGTIVGSIRAQGEGVPHKFSVFNCTSTDGGKTWNECTLYNRNGFSDVTGNAGIYDSAKQYFSSTGYDVATHPDKIVFQGVEGAPSGVCARLVSTATTRLCS